jgi:hypothetical protein
MLHPDEPRFVGRARLVETLDPPGVDSGSRKATLAYLASSNTVIMRVVAAISDQGIATDPVRLLQSLKVEPAEGVDGIQIEFTSSDKQETLSAVKLFAAEFGRFYRELDKVDDKAAIQTVKPPSVRSAEKGKWTAETIVAEKPGLSRLASAPPSDNPAQRMDKLVKLAMSDEVLRRSAESIYELGLPTLDIAELRKGLRIKPVENTQILQIEFACMDAEAAKSTVDIVAAELQRSYRKTGMGSTKKLQTLDPAYCYPRERRIPQRSLLSAALMAAGLGLAVFAVSRQQR